MTRERGIGSSPLRTLQMSCSHRETGERVRRRITEAAPRDGFSGTVSSRCVSAEEEIRSGPLPKTCCRFMNAIA